MDIVHLFTLSSVSEHLDYFLFIIMNYVIINMQVFSEDDFISLRYIPRIGIAGVCAKILFSGLRN